MFNKELPYLTLTSDIADEIFPNISGRPFYNDNSFLATLRALLAHRMAKDDTLWLDVRVRNDRESTLKDYSTAEGVQYLCEGIANNTILVCSFNGTESGVSASFKLIDDSFLECYPKYKEIPELKIFSQKHQINVRFYINEEDRSAAIFVGSMNTRIWHFIQSFTSRILPWYFKENPLGDEEKALVVSLTYKTAPAYEKLIEKFASEYDFRGKKIEKMLGGFETRAKKQQLSVVKNEVLNQKNAIHRWENDYLRMLQDLENLMIKECGLEQQINNCNPKDSEMVEFFSCNRHINPISVSDNYMEIIVDTTIDNYDPDMFERMYKNDASFLYQGYTVSEPTFQDVNVRKKFINAIFGEDAVLKVKVCAYYNLDLRGSVSSRTDYMYPAEYTDFLVNPHIKIHSCIGNNRPHIDKYLRDGDYISAITQCQSSAMNLNLSEGSQTVAPFLGWIFSSSCKSVILMPDGSSKTPVEAYKWLLEQEENKDNTQEVEK